ncbi:MAG: bifunctional 3,4-dihydroxy-2-butanone-4-phosphate synthase/GTP cyclohydrolase II [Cytophagia bacterium]|nr:MAG: bifunctional 3,4-dihydroxy-2-butanone-4-phosphate synthase/GTP cyclohydrolase II [Cytophagia bacterium]TAG43227.1 MAG: bifunctional 3,4-dihydroxy-2-butanone-4-phosphate synthase/GTP cyclohydrolase II [Cytophagia bacterium]TAH31506.1 MAG: bifunctional 3,4-dihydroxy-2-butanone-4-phosphate synthase/GTP cyclohydrolase II [Cytophagales bacterium]
MQEKIKLDTVEEAIKAIKNGEFVIVVDDEDRENEGDFICAAECITPEKVNFVLKEGRGLLCVAITEQRATELELNLMVGQNTDPMKTAFTVTVDLLGNGCTTGISAYDRAKTILALADKKTSPADLGRPGHINPLKAKEGGVLRRTGHTEATVDLAKLAGFEPVGVLIEIMNEDGTMARLPQLRILADRLGLKLISIEDLIAYRLRNESLITKEVDINMPTEWGSFKLTAYRQLNTGELHLALTKGTWEKGEAILTRVHSSCMTGDIFGSCRCDCGPQLHKAMEMVEKEGRGVILYMNQEGRGIGLVNKLKAYQLQEQGMDTVQANQALGFKMDERDYGIGAQILRDLNVTKLKLMSNNPKKRAGLIGYGLEVVERIPIEIASNEHNEKYLQTKRDKLGHEILQ